ncbi:MAG: hypothetical protein GEU78_09670 [Actinobacteria bacterium]|nr:hypothetical protein [Actinomycetota bacterium]
MPDLRAASSGFSNAQVGSVATTLPIGWQPGDLILLVAGCRNTGASALNIPSGWTQESSDANSGDSSGQAGGLFSRVMQAGDTAPSVSMADTGKWAWCMIAIQPDSGGTLSFDGAIAKTIDTTTDTTSTPPVKTASISGVMSVLIELMTATANGSTAIDTTPPTNWTEPANGDASTNAGNNAQLRQISASCSYRPWSGAFSVTPGSLSTNVTCVGNLYHALVQETGGGGTAHETTAEPFTLNLGYTAPAASKASTTTAEPLTSTLVYAAPAASKASTTTVGPFAVAPDLGSPAASLATATIAEPFAIAVTYAEPIAGVNTAADADQFQLALDFEPASTHVAAFPGDPGAGVLLSGCTVYTGSGGVPSGVDWIDIETGRRHVLSRSYSSNGNGWDWTQIDDDLTVDRIPFHTSKFTNFTNAQIVAGSADATLTTQANNAIARAPSPLWLGFYHEPEDNFESDAAAAEFRAAARYIAGFMRVAGVTNVAWVFPVWMVSWSFRGGEAVRGGAWKWDPDWKGTLSGAGVPAAADWWTGTDSVIDLIGMDQYTPWIGGTTYNTFDFDVGYSANRLFTEWGRPVKPIAIGECGTKDDATPTPDWTAHFAEVLESCVDNDVRGLVYYNTDNNNFITADPTGLRFAGYNAMIQDTRVGDIDVAGVPDEPEGPVAPTYHGGDVGGGGGLISHTVPWPAGVQAGDYAVLSWVFSITQTHVLPAGFTLVSTFDGDSGSHRMAVCERICDGTESGTVTIELSGITKQSATLTVYRGLHATAPLDDFAVHNATGTTVHNCPAVTTGFDDCVIATIYSERVTDASSNATIASPYVERADTGGISSAGGGGTMVAFADDGLATPRLAGSVVTPPDWTGLTSTANVITWTLSLRPAEDTGTAHETTAQPFVVGVAYSAPTVRQDSTTTAGNFATPVGFNPPAAAAQLATTAEPLAFMLAYDQATGGMDSTTTAEGFTLALDLGLPVVTHAMETTAEPLTLALALLPPTLLAESLAGITVDLTGVGVARDDVELAGAGTVYDVTGVGTAWAVDGVGTAPPSVTVGVAARPVLSGPGMGDREELTGVGTARRITGIGV